MIMQTFILRFLAVLRHFLSFAAFRPKSDLATLLLLSLVALLALVSFSPEALAKKKDKSAAQESSTEDATNDSAGKKAKEKVKNKVKNKDKTAEKELPDVSIPLLYLTDRNLEEGKENYGSKRKYIIDCKHDMYYGTANVLVKNYEHKTDKELFEHLGWKEEKKGDPDIVACDKIDDKDPDKAKADFFKRIESTLAASGSDRLCLFVHGACEGFDDAAQDAAALAYSVEYPVVFYSWPSVPKTLKYVVDGGNNEWSQEHFNMFLNDLLQFRNEHKIHLIIVSHSMGNRLVMRAAHLLERTQLVRDAELVSPDIDAETFKHYILGMENQGAVIRLYTSSQDKMLALSQMVYGGYYRLGEGVGSVFSGLSTGKKPKEEPDKIISENASSGDHLPHHKKGMAERIDFTEVDEGFRGHSIPFDMLASMIRNDVPGKGLKLVSATPGKGSSLARFMSWSHKLGKIDDEGDTDLCKKIVKTDEKVITGSR